MKNASLKQMLVFMLKLTSLCMLFLLIARGLVGERAELTPRTANAALRLTQQLPPISDAEALELFGKSFEQKQRGKFKLWHSKEQPALWLCEATGPGMWGSLTALILFETTPWQIKGLRVIEQMETAGLGSRIAEPEFSEKFENLVCEAGVELAKIKIKNNQFDAITGATQSSKAIESLINSALRSLRAKLGEATE